MPVPVSSVHHALIADLKCGVESRCNDHVTECEQLRLSPMAGSYVYQDHVKSLDRKTACKNESCLHSNVEAASLPWPVFEQAHDIEAVGTIANSIWDESREYLVLGQSSSVSGKEYMPARKAVQHATSDGSS